MNTWTSYQGIGIAQCLMTGAVSSAGQNEDTQLSNMPTADAEASANQVQARNTRPLRQEYSFAHTRQRLENATQQLRSNYN